MFSLAAIPGHPKASTRRRMRQLCPSHWAILELYTDQEQASAPLPPPTPVGLSNPFLAADIDILLSCCGYGWQEVQVAPPG